MTIWESGRESGLLDDIIAGRKTIEGRLKRGKFAEYRVDDVIKLRRDIRDESGVLHDGEPDQARVKIVGIREYSDFLSMCRSEGYERVIPSAKSVETAASEYNKFYSAEHQAEYGVLAIEVAII
jgi:ASC-1-like (ASCH) protein